LHIGDKKLVVRFSLIQNWVTKVYLNLRQKPFYPTRPIWRCHRRGILCFARCLTFYKIFVTRYLK
jgi:hypothetical protein